MLFRLPQRLQIQLEEAKSRVASQGILPEFQF